LVAGVSGGSDSLALLLLLAALRAEWGWTLTVAHVHHGLRGDAADADQRFVEDWASRLAVPVEVRRVQVEAGPGRSLEMAAREARRRALKEIADPRQGLVVLAHHAEDQAETVLLRMIRGTGVAGLAAMRPVVGRTVRPLLGYHRHELQSFLQALGVTWREDASNRDWAMTRNRIRHQLVPLLTSYNPRVVDALNRLARSAAEVEDWAGAEARRWYLSHRMRDEVAGELRLPGVRNLARALAERALRLAAEELGLALTEEQVDRALDGPTVWPRHHTVEWQGNDLVVATPFEPPAWPPDPVPLPASGWLPLPLGHLAVRPAGPEEKGLDLRVPLFVRGWAPGDRIVLRGTGQKKLQDVFVDRKVPRRLRHAWPVVVTGTGLVVAVPGLAVDPAWTSAPGTGIVLAWVRDAAPPS
jgi:tRNA(Ile)-lysidine synthase